MATFHDRNGSTWTIRPLGERDLAGWVVLHQALTTDGRGMIMDPDEAAADIDEARDRCGDFLDGSDHLALVAVDDDGVVGGSCELTRMPRRRIRHVALLGMGIHPDHQGKGLGRALLEDALAWADTHDVTRVELYTREDNDRAIALYESVGFVHEGTRRSFTRDPDGHYVDDRIYGRVRA